MDIVADKLKVNGLSAKTVTIDGFDIKTYFEGKLSAAVNFKGVFDSLDDAEKKNGNIVIVDGLEYIYEESSGEWKQFGDENFNAQAVSSIADAYAVAAADPMTTSAEVSSIIEGYKYDEKLAGVEDKITAEVDPMATSAEVSSIIEGYGYAEKIYALENLVKKLQVKLDKCSVKPTFTAVSQQAVVDALSDETVSEIVLEMTQPLSVERKMIEIPTGKDVVIDLNGQEIQAVGTMDKNNDAAIAVKYGGKLVIDDSNATGLVTVEGTNAFTPLKLTVKGETDNTEPAELVVNGGSFIGNYYTICGNGSRSNTVLEINDGYFEATVENDSVVLFHPQDGECVINGGTFKGGICIWQKAGDVVINSGTFTATGISAEYVFSNNGFNNTGDCIVIDNCNYPGGAPSIKINGGTFISENARPVASYVKPVDPAPEKIVKFVYGGRFNKRLDEDLIADGYEQIEKDGWYIVVQK